MEEDLKKILLGGIFESTDGNEKLTIESFHTGIKILVELFSDHFEEVPNSISITNETFSEIENKAGNPTGLIKDTVTEHGKHASEHINFFDKKGILIYDGIHGSAFGRFSYVYRSKGMRIHLFEDGEFKVFSTYCTIDHNGFMFANEEVDSFHIDKLTTKNSIIDLIKYTITPDEDNVEINVSVFILQLLTNYNKSYIKDWYLEYLLNPPDVIVLSDQSKEIKNELWNICLSEEYSNIWVDKLQIETMKLLSQLQIPPSPEQILKFTDFKESTAQSFEKVFEKLKLIEDTVVAESKKEEKEHIIEFKPNIAGMGLNGNEIWDRIKKYF